MSFACAVLKNAHSQGVVAATLADALYAAWLYQQRRNACQGHLLGALLDHAATTVPFYRHHVAEMVSVRSLVSETFTAVSRAEICANPEAHISTCYQRDDLIWHSTSGTSGIPLRIPKDLASFYCSNYDFYRCISEYLPSFGQDLIPGKVAAIVLDDLPSRAAYTYINPAINFAVIHRLILGRSDEQDESILRELRRSRPLPLLIGRPRALCALASLDLGNNLTASAIMSSGDNLYPDVRRLLENHFSCQVFNAYSSQEAGTIGVECSFRNGMHILRDRATVSICAPNGVIGNSASGYLTVTGFENWALPFINYVTDDWAEVRQVECECGYKGPSIISITGRDSPYFVAAGQLINPSLLNPIFSRDWVKQFQVVQPSAGVCDVYLVFKPGVQEVASKKGEISKLVGEILPGLVVSVFPMDKIVAGEAKAQRYVCKVDSSLV